MTKNYTNSIVTTLEPWFAKMPNLPKGGQDFIVKITPWFALIFGALGVLGSLSALGLLTTFSPLSVFDGVKDYGAGFLSAFFALASSVVLLMAYPGTKARRNDGWTKLVWSQLINFAGSIVALNILSGIIGALIGFYILFQIKSYYK